MILQQITDNKPVLAGMVLAVLLSLFLIVDLILSNKVQLEKKVMGLEKQAVSVAELSQQLSAGGSAAGGVSANQINALLPWLEKRFNLAKMSNKVERIALKPRADSRYREVVGFTLTEISMLDLLTLLEQFEQIHELHLLKVDIVRANTQGLSFAAELGLESR